MTTKETKDKLIEEIIGGKHYQICEGRKCICCKEVFEAVAKSEREKIIKELESWKIKDEKAYGVGVSQLKRNALLEAIQISIKTLNPEYEEWLAQQQKEARVIEKNL